MIDWIFIWMVYYCWEEGMGLGIWLLRVMEGGKERKGMEKEVEFGKKKGICILLGL